MKQKKEKHKNIILFKKIVKKGSPTNIVKSKLFETTEPEQTLWAIVGWLENESFDSIGIACFGPVDLNKKSKTYGQITSTPKLKWQNTKVVQVFEKFGKPIGFDTDVNGPALAELYYGNHKPGTNSLCYISVGTGVGVGIIVDGRPVHGAMHPEAGHVCVRRHEEDEYKGDCEFHGDCLEGMTRISSIMGRCGLECHKELPNVGDNHPVWHYVAYYLAQLCLSLTLVASPDVIVFGGGIINRESLLPSIRTHFKILLNEYVQVKNVKEVDTYIIRSVHKNDSGIIGAFELSKRAFLGDV